MRMYFGSTGLGGDGYGPSSSSLFLPTSSSHSLSLSLPPTSSPHPPPPSLSHSPFLPTPDPFGVPAPSAGWTPPCGTSPAQQRAVPASCLTAPAARSTWSPAEGRGRRREGKEGREERESGWKVRLHVCISEAKTNVTMHTSFHLTPHITSPCCCVRTYAPMHTIHTCRWLSAC